jgi:succinoglycan biosynthesis protein ExoW
VVYSFRQFPLQRFKVEFTNAGEDYLFWMELVRGDARIAFSTQIAAQYGRGVNVYAGSGWGSEQHLLRLHNELKYRITTTRLFALTADQRAHIKTCARELRHSFARDLLHRLAHRKPLPWKVLKQHFRLEPWGILRLPIELLVVAVGRAKQP